MVYNTKYKLENRFLKIPMLKKVIEILDRALIKKTPCSPFCHNNQIYMM